MTDQPPQEPYRPPASQWQGPTLAAWPKRAGAYLIDNVAVAAATFVVALVLGVVSDALAVLVLIVGYLGALAFALYNAYLGGETGQSIGKRQLGITLLGEETGRTIGGGMGIARVLLHSVWGLLCGVGAFVNFLFPLWDPKRQTVTDKLLKTVVIEGGAPGAST